MDARSIAREVMEYLLLRLRTATPQTLPSLTVPEVHVASGALFGFRRVGLLDETDEEHWQEQILEESRRLTAALKDEVAHPNPRRPGNPAVNGARVAGILNGQLGMVEGQIRAAASEGRILHPRDNPALGAAHAIVRAFAELGVLSSEDEDAWRHTFDRAADPDSGPLVSYTVRPDAGRVVEARTTVRVSDVQAPLIHPPPRSSRQTLLDVLLIRCGPEDGVRLEFVEVYTDGFAVNWTGLPVPRHLAERGYMPLITPRVRATDDLGTFYFPSQNGGGGATGERARGQHSFAPAISPKASELHVSLDDYGFLIKLPGCRARHEILR